MKSFEIRTREKFLEIEKKIKALFTRDVAYNLLDNSDFTNPVNQRGATSYTATGYNIDRWNAWSPSSIDVKSGYISVVGLTNTWFRQYLDSTLLFGKTLTVAVKTSDGNVYLATGTYPSVNPTSETKVAQFYAEDFTLIFHAQTNRGAVQLKLNDNATVNLVWAALYEGEYTAETLPEYIPKGYAHELLECQRYFERISTMNNNEPAFTTFASGCFNAADIFLGVLNVMPKRVAPNVTFNGNFRIRNNGAYAVTAMESNKTMSTQTTVYIKATVSGAIAGYGGLLQSNNDANAYIDISADL